MCCYVYDKTPCEGLEYGVDMLDAMQNRFDLSTAESEGYVIETGNGNEVSNNRIRFTMYQMFTFETIGCLG